MSEYGIPYLNSTLISGIPGTGKTEFAKYVAYRLDLPYAYLNFSYLIDSYLGKTAQNLRKVFDYCKGQKCVLMLDEVDFEPSFLTDEILSYADEPHTQAEIIQYLINAIVEKISEEK